MAKAKKEPKPRAEKYEEKLKIHGTFEDVIKASFIASEKKLKALKDNKKEEGK